MKCIECGLDNPGNGNFCLHCGKPLSAQGEALRTGIVAENVVQNDEGAVRFTPEDQMKEVVHFDEHPSMRTSLPVILILLVIGIAAILLLGMVPVESGAVQYMGLPILQAIALAVTLILIVGWWLKFFIRVQSTRYKLTSQRMFTVHGLFSKRTDELELEKYKDVIVHQSFMNKMMGCGDVKIVTGDVTSPTVDLVDVVDPIAKKEIIRSAARQRKSDLGINRREEL